ncbi:outer membrane protein assembly factor BamB family protein [Sinosporangium siamense]|uniref:Pyrrolo-quinoline quinone repeat domain-containing protein n=1 Tax=Sinosporangium siamense TaxID=1367973 RepID=A0A919RJM2_9ACTN|nr:PQQ-binding-like beta-propeller repeat protein [Sinosporangium siamense]GII93236.1 hypothetical protein Ssi02_34670 [Sinosporangium siamense]
MTVIRPYVPPALSLAGVMLLAACAGSDAATAQLPTWTNSSINPVSRVAVAAGTATATSMRPDGSLSTVALDLASGKTLWTHPATMAGRLPGMGVPAPAITTAGSKAVIAAIDPAKQGKWNATLHARDARTGSTLWTRPVHSTFGPQRCGPYFCVSEHTALSAARVVVLDPATGKTIWKIPGVAEVEWSDAGRVILLRLAANPVLESYELKTGKLIWQQPIDQALGKNLDLSGGWAFGATGDNLVGYLAPYTNPRTKRTSGFGLFSVKLADGTVNWMRPSVVRVYPSGSPAFAPVVRPVDPAGAYGGFARLDADTGRVMGQIGAAQVPGSGWWLAFPTGMERMGFLKHGSQGSAYDMASGRPMPVKGQHGWSFCQTDPKPLPLPRQPSGFYSVAALCEFDLASGKRVATPSPPPAWFTGSQEGWRIWRDEKGTLHGVKDGSPSLPGMYG